MSFKQKKIFVLGFMGCGKSTIGKALAKKLEMKFVDLDSVIEVRNGRTVAEIFSLQGEEAFRNMESQTLNLAQGISSLVISLGGGTPCYKDNISTIVNSGISFYLELSAERLADRLFKEKEHRPLIKEPNSRTELITFIKEKLAKRKHFYRQASHVVRAERSIDEIVDEIISLLDF